MPCLTGVPSPVLEEFRAKREKIESEEGVGAASVRPHFSSYTLYNNVEKVDRFFLPNHIKKSVFLPPVLKMKSYVRNFTKSTINHCRQTECRCG
jgi:hypothetical protein